MNSIFTSFRLSHQPGLTATAPRLKLLALCLTSAILLGTSIASADNAFYVDWSDRLPGSVPERVEGDLRLAFVSILSDKSALVNAGTDPVNPFSHLENSLYVNSEAPDAGWFRLVARPFPDEPALQGALEFEFRIVSGSINLSVGICELPWQPDDFATYAVVAGSGFGAAFRPGEYVNIKGRPMRSGMSELLEPDKNYTFLVKWDFGGTTELFTFYLNGEQLTFEGGGSLFPIPAAGEMSGINAFRITIGSSNDKAGAIFLGRLAATSGDKDMYSTKGILQTPTNNPSPSR